MIFWAILKYYKTDKQDITRRREDEFYFQAVTTIFYERAQRGNKMLFLTTRK